MQNKIYMMVDRDQLQEVVEESVRNAMKADVKLPIAEFKQLGEYVPQIEAMKILNRKTTWFHLKRKTGELQARKSANQWWYKRSDLENYVNSGFESIPNY